MALAYLSKCELAIGFCVLAVVGRSVISVVHGGFQKKGCAIARMANVKSIRYLIGKLIQKGIGDVDNAAYLR